MMIIKLILVLATLILTTYLFRKASSTLNIGKINVISYIYYLFILQTYIGISLAFLGDRNHYTFRALISTKSIDITFYCVMLTAILFPGIIVLIYKIFKINIANEYNEYLKKDTKTNAHAVTFVFIAVFSVFLLVLLILYLIKIGYVPLIKLIQNQADMNYSVERIKISKISIINNYIRNIAILSFIPLMSYITFCFAVTTKKVRWIVLFAIMFIASLIVKTYNFEKSPIIFHLFIFALMYIYINGGMHKKLMFFIVSGLGVLIALMYALSGYQLLNGIDIYSGPIGRTIFTQAGCLTFHFDLFPSPFPFLGGRSFANTLLRILGSDLSHLRSGRVVMDYYGSSSVYEGTGGVMNAFFIGEAYANYGYLGVLLSIVYIAVLIAFFYYIFLKIEKNPLNIALFALLTSKIALTSLGGFTDFVYNFDAIITIMLVVSINLVSKRINYYLLKRSKQNQA